MITREEAVKNIIDIINDMSESDMIYLHNEYCEEMSYYDDRIYSYYEINDLCSSMTPPTEIIETYGEIAYCDYFKCGVHIKKADLTDVWVDNIAEYCVENDYDFDNSDIRDIIDKLAESEEEDEE